MSDALARALRLFELRHSYCMIGEPAEETGCRAVTDRSGTVLALIYPEGEALAELLDEAHNIGALYEEAEALTLEADDLRERIEDLAADLREAEEKYDDDTADLRAEIARLEDQLSELRAALEDARADRDDLAAELERLQGV